METNRIDYDDVPKGFMHCIASNCPLSATCLRAIAWRILPGDITALQIVNPAKATAADGCPFYRDNTPVRFAIGFTKMQQRMYPGQYAEFSRRLISHFGRNPYFVRRRGELPLPPSEQAYILKVLKTVGAPADLGFDRYEDRYFWVE